MSISSTSLATRYVGNGSVVTAYVIPWPFLDASHVFAAVSSDGVVEPVLLSPSAYTVTRLADGSGGSLLTVAAVTSPAEIVIFRATPLTQPTSFQIAGPFPAKSAETALDRLLMQVQELSKRLDDLDLDEGLPGGSGVVKGVMDWLDSTARAAVKPDRAGQLGVERSTQTVWIAQSTTIGDWEEFLPQRANRLVIGLIADGGAPGAAQTAAAALLTTWDPDAVLFAGDNNYDGPTDYSYGADWAAFAAFIAAGIAYPALGNHDVDYTGWEARHAAKFPYLPGNKRYYTVTLGGGLVDVFVLHSGFDSIRDLVEPDGNEVGSVQHAWFVAALAASRARWRIAVFHHPPVTLEGTADVSAPEMAWPELARMDLICCGHTHLLELLKWSDCMLVNVSALSHTDGQAEAVLQGADVATSWPLWADDQFTGLGRIVATQDRLQVEIWRTDGALLHARSFDNFTPNPPKELRFLVIAPTTTIGEMEDTYVGTLSAPTILLGVMVAAATAGSIDASWTLSGDGVELATGVLAAGETFVLADSLVPLEMLPTGTLLTLNSSDTPSDALGLDMTLFIQRHK